MFSEVTEHSIPPSHCKTMLSLSSNVDIRTSTADSDLECIKERQTLNASVLWKRAVLLHLKGHFFFFFFPVALHNAFI